MPYYKNMPLIWTWTIMASQLALMCGIFWYIEGIWVFFPLLLPATTIHLITRDWREWNKAQAEEQPGQYVS